MLDEEQIRFWGHVAATLYLLHYMLGWNFILSEVVVALAMKKSLAVILFDNEL